MDVPEVETPSWQPPVPVISHAYFPNSDQTLQPGTQVQFVSSVLSGSTPVQNLTWDPNVSSMQICTTPESSSSVGQQELPRELQTPGKGTQQLMKPVQGDLDMLKQFIQRQETTVSELTQEVKDKYVQHSTQVSTAVVTMEDNQKQLFKCIADNQQKMEAEMDQWTKVTKRLITEELNQIRATLVSEVRFLIQQFQAEVQQDLKVTSQSLEDSQEQLTKEFHQCKIQMDDLCSNVQKLNSDLSKDLQTQIKELTTSQPQPTIEARTVRCYPQQLHQDRCWTGEHFRPIIRGLANMKKTVQSFHLRAGTVK
ncbi:hypothetical protein G5714_020362 [Onychostoma macrolepis]|uniref:Uncharacterized protein n=1 Tax=Onychostoma macrolepis TaxID=369639 RepID=A0A7J6BXF5_9TELE|nr:hypothetical protein G5714_020362 [Onychostoma macrolepis]